MAEYITNGIRHHVFLEPLPVAIRHATAQGPEPQRAMVAQRVTNLVTGLQKAETFSSRFVAMEESRMFVVRREKTGGRRAKPSAPEVLVIATESVVLGGAHLGDIDWAKKKFGVSVAEEGSEGKVLLRLPGDGEESVTQAFNLALELHHERGVGFAHPNFVRALPRIRLAPNQTDPQWPKKMLGVPEAWKISKGKADVRVAVLDEGVDTSHPSLAPAVVLQRDFIGSKGNSAMPDNDDAHGTACAGIILSRDAIVSGIAPRVSLIAARIAMGDGNDRWIFDDFKTADAIDWCWKTANASVLSNSWGGGPPVDVITRAFERARTLGRNGLGSVVLVAAGNDQIAVQYPATLQGVLAVGASNEFDERKTRTSQDGENWWGSNYGPDLALLAPGVHIGTTDIAGPRGYDPGDFDKKFNGTSAATPHVAATAALVLSVAPNLTAAQVRQILIDTAKKLKGQSTWTPKLGHGRLDVAAAVAAAKAAPPSPTIITGTSLRTRPPRASHKRSKKRPGKSRKKRSVVRKSGRSKK